MDTVLIPLYITLIFLFEGYGKGYLKFYLLFLAADIIIKFYLYLENLELHQAIFSQKAEENEVRENPYSPVTLCCMQSRYLQPPQTQKTPPQPSIHPWSPETCTFFLVFSQPSPNFPLLNSSKLSHLSYPARNLNIELNLVFIGKQSYIKLKTQFQVR